MFQAEENLSEQEAIAGDFRYLSPNGLYEAILRLQPGGKWWHSAHCQTVDRGANTDWWYREVATESVWEMAESLGSWRVEPLFEDGEANGIAVVLQCESCRWVGGKQSSLDGSSKLRLDDQQGCCLDSLIGSGQVALCYAMRWSPATGKRSLILQMEAREASHAGHSGPGVADPREAFQLAVQGLGFARCYQHQQPEARGRRRAAANGVHRCRPSVSPNSKSAETSLSNVKDSPASNVAGASPGGGAAAVAASYLTSEGAAVAEEEVSPEAVAKETVGALTPTLHAAAGTWAEEDEDVFAELPYGSLDGSA
mmetsp:Transcript_12627/g.25688  ORF Transcript_12627/g.25688 Transcript_12627/m.25688 type:complete len:311 (+) Transcript_12627:101-1033(+)